MKATAKKQRSNQKKLSEVDLDVLRQVKAILNINDHTYNEMLFNAAIRYLESDKNSLEYVKEVKYKKWFWKLYRKWYLFHDTVFIVKVIKTPLGSELNNEELLKLYIDIHENVMMQESRQIPGKISTETILKQKDNKYENH